MKPILAAIICAVALATPAHADPAVVPAARDAIGTPYQWGGTDLDGMDCSGLVVWAYKQIGVTVPRTSQALARNGTPVKRGNLQPGDVISFYPSASHVAIYAGHGQVIHASTYGQPVAEVPMREAGPVHNIRRY